MIVLMTTMGTVMKYGARLMGGVKGGVDDKPQTCVARNNKLMTTMTMTIKTMAMTTVSDVKDVDDDDGNDERGDETLITMTTR